MVRSTARTSSSDKVANLDLSRCLLTVAIRSAMALRGSPFNSIGASHGKFQSISEPWANTTTQAGKMIMTIFAGIAEFERDLIRERTGAGREAAKQRGVRFGRPRKLNTDQAEVAAQLLSEGKAVRDIARTFCVHEATIYRLAAAL
jgi:hypothetical protein